MTLTDVEETISEYNEAVAAYNQKAQEYNEAVTQILNENDKRRTAIEAAQMIAESGEIPLDAETLTAENQNLILKSKIR